MDATLPRKANRKQCFPSWHETCSPITRTPIRVGANAQTWAVGGSDNILTWLAYFDSESKRGGEEYEYGFGQNHSEAGGTGAGRIYPNRPTRCSRFLGRSADHERR